MLIAAASLMPRELKSVVQGVGEGESAQPLERLGDHEQRHDPAGEVADRVEKTVVAVEGDHPADAQERCGRKVIAGEGDAVDEPVDLPVGGISSPWRPWPCAPR